MNSRLRFGGRIALPALALVGSLGVFTPPAAAQDHQCAGACQGPSTCQHRACNHHHGGAGVGTLGYGPPGYYAGFQGFGLGYCLGYGYGGKGLGPGADGGYPFYGGPGYPQCWPTLRRCGGINPFPYFGGPGYPRTGYSNYFGEVGPLSASMPVIEIAPEPGEADPGSGYGGFTGTVPYSEETLAPFTTRAGAYGSSSGVSTLRPAPPASNAPAGRESRPMP
jgi:hypothetical protein